MSSLLCPLLNNKKMEPRNDHTSAASSEQTFLRQEDSDFLPSVSLAAVLFLIFTLVSTLLLYSAAHQEPISRSRRVIWSNRLISQDHRLEKLKLLFPSQTEDTWWTLQSSLNQRWLIEKPSGLVDIPFIAIAREGTTNSLLCLTKNIMSLLSAAEQIPFHVIRSQQDDPRSIYFLRRQGCNSEVPVLAIAVVVKRKGIVPYGIYQGIHCSRDGGSNLWKSTLSLRIDMENVADHVIHNLANGIASKILASINITGRVPDTFSSISMGNLPILHINSEYYLERGFVC